MPQMSSSYTLELIPYLGLVVAIGIGIPFLLRVSHPSRWLLAFSILFLCLVPVGGDELANSFSNGELVSSTEGSLFRQIGWGSVFLLALAYTLRGKGRISIPWRWVPLPYLLLLFYALVSVIWSEVPLVSARRAIQLVGVLLISLALVRQANYGNPFTAFAWPGMFFLVLGIVALAVPELSIDPDGNYKGFTFTKNVWGQFALFMSLIFIFLALSNTRQRLYWWLFILSTLSLFATLSATTILIYFIAINILLYFFTARRSRSKFFRLSLATTMFALISLSTYFLLGSEVTIENFFAVIGKDTTLTGRTVLWQWMSYEIAKHPWFGIGYGGFWMEMEGPSYDIVQFFSWRPGQAHNGYIDIINEMGYFGFGLFLLMIIKHIVNIFKLHCQNDEFTAIFHLSVLVATLLLNMSETNFMRTTNLWWIILSASIFSVHTRLRVQGQATSLKQTGMVANYS